MYRALLELCVGADDRAVAITVSDLMPVAESTLLELGGVHAKGTVVASEADASIETRMMSPEQALGRSLDARSDLWTVAVLLYRALTGAWPFDGATPEELAIALSRRPHRAPSVVAPRLGTTFDAFFVRALKKDAVDRYQTAEELLRAFTLAAGTAAAVLESTTGEADREANAPRLLTMIEAVPLRGTRRPGSRVYLLGFVLIVLLGVGVYVLRAPEHQHLNDQFEDELGALPASAIPAVKLPGKRELELPLSQPFILNIWLERCADCLPKFNAWRDASRAGKIPTAPIVNVSAYRGADEGWAENYRVDEQLVWDDGKALVRPLGVRSFTTFVVRPDGVIVFRGHADQPGFTDALANALATAKQ